MTDKKSYGLSRNWEVIKLSEEIRRYVLKNDDCARVELLNQIINGGDLAEALGYLKSEIKGDEQGIIKEDENKMSKLIKGLEEIIKGKEGTIIKEIKEKINEYK